MSNAWLSIPLEDYEGHMGLDGVRQLAALTELFRCTLDRCLPQSVAVLGVAGGNGLEQIDPSVTRRIVGIDINERYLNEVQRRFATLPGLELHCRDLAQPGINIAAVALVHAALIFEHAGLSTALENALSLVASGGSLSVVLQLPGEIEPGGAATKHPSMQTLRSEFTLIDPQQFETFLRQKGFQLVTREHRALPAGKALGLGVFTRIPVA